MLNSISFGVQGVWNFQCVLLKFELGWLWLNTVYEIPLHLDVAWQVSVVSVVNLIDWTELIWPVEVIKLVVSLSFVVLDTISVGIVYSSWFPLEQALVNGLMLLLLHVLI